MKLPCILAVCILLSGCATPIADAYNKERINTPYTYIVRNSIGAAEMIVLNPLVYYPMELTGVHHFGILLKEPAGAGAMDDGETPVVATDKESEAAPVKEAIDPSDSDPGQGIP